MNIPIPKANINDVNIMNTYIENPMETKYLLSFIESFLIVFLSELADKTFLLILILKLKSNSTTVFFSSLLAMVFLSSLSIMLGYCSDYFLYQNFIDLMSVIILICSSIGLIIQGFSSTSKTYEDEVLNSIKVELKQEKKKETREYNKVLIHEQVRRMSREKLDDIPSSINTNSNNYNILYNKAEEKEICCSYELGDSLNEPLLMKSSLQLNRLDNQLHLDSSHSNLNMQLNEEGIQRKNDQDGNNNNNNDAQIKGVCYYFWAFTKTILITEFGDRTQFALYAMSSVFNSYGVLYGAILALIIVIFIGVFYGENVSKVIGEKMMCWIAGVLFLGVSLQVIYVNDYLNFLN